MAIIRLFLIVMLLASPCWAATYYIDPVGGSDSNDGLTEEAARQTAPTPFVNGDTYLWKRGTSQVITGGRNTTRNNCVIGAYGTGARPILSDPDGYVLSFGTGAYNWTVRDIHFTDCAFGIQNATGNTLDGLVIDNCRFDNITTSAIRLNYDGSIEIKSCQFDNVDSTTCNLYANTNASTNEYYSEDSGYAWVHHCEFNNGGEEGEGNLDVISIKGTGLVEYNKITDQNGSNGSGVDCAHTRSDGLAPSVTVRGNTLITGEGHAFGLNSESANNAWVRIENNYVNGYKDGAYAYGYGRYDIYNNTFVACTYYGIRGGIGGDANTRNMYIKGNIISGDETAKISLPAPNGYTIESDYNCLYDLSAGGDLNLYYESGEDTLSTWQGRGYDTHSITSNPLLDGYQPSSTSPCIGAGTAFTTSDFLGVERPQGAAHDIGCIERRSGTHYGSTGTGMVLQ